LTEIQLSIFAREILRVADTTEPNDDEQAAETPTDDAAAQQPVDEEEASSADPDSYDELPEDEPLTPEIVEEEAIRGDFMLRWAAILLMVLFAFSKFNDTRLLVQIRSGEQMQSAGFMPPRTDALSFTAEGETVANTSWLLDHVLALSWQLGGTAGLTLLKVAIAAIIGYLLSRISVPDMPTWWSSICAMLAAVAVAGHLMPAAELMTLLGVVLALNWLHQYQQGTAQGLAWKIPVLVAVWCNLDSRAWLGPAIVLLFAFGQTLRQRRALRLAGATDESGNGESLWLTGAVSVAALLINPFPANSLFSPVAYYSVEVPSMQMQRALSSSLAGTSHDNRVDYFSALNPDAMEMFDHTQIAALTLIVIAIVVIVISRSRADMPWLVALLGVSFLGISKLHELPVAALIAAVAASTVAQRWYRRNYTLTYSTDTRELMFSRGGRAATVFAMAFLAFCIVAGRLPGQTPLGFGFEPDTATTIRTLGEQVAELDDDARIMNTRIDQGDILIWHGRKSCIDSRLIPFGRSSDPDSIIARHREILEYKLHPQRPVPPQQSDGTADPQEFEKKIARFDASVARAGESIDDFEITHIMPRMAPPGAPDIISVQSLMASGEWLMTDIGASAIVMERVQRTWTQEERAAKSYNYVQAAFRDSEPVTVLREFAQPINFYEKWVYRRRPEQNEAVRLSKHYLRFSEAQPTSIDDVLMCLSMATLSIRNSNLALAEDSQNAQAWRQLGRAFQRLGQLEQQLASSQGGQSMADMRYYQTVMSLRQALRINPDDLAAWQALGEEVFRRGSVDMTLECLANIPQPDATAAADPAAQAAASERYERERELKDRQRAQNEQIAKYLEENPLATDPTERGDQVTALATQVARNGFQLRAVELLREHSDVINRNVMGQVLLGDLLLQTGECEEAYSILNQLANVAREDPVNYQAVGWNLPTALSQLVMANYGEATSLLNMQLQQFDGADKAPETWATALMTAPLGADSDVEINTPGAAWPVLHAQGLQIPMKGIPAIRAGVLLQTAMLHVEEGNTERAKLFFRTIVSDFGNTPYRPLAIYYLLLIDEDAVEFVDQYTLDDWEVFEDQFTATDTGAQTDSADAAAVVNPQPQ
jgi:tetratricopeptide (TPR) repeat protein